MHIEYNGVKLKLTEITECIREAVYDPSGTDLLFIRWRLGVVATLGSGGYPAGTALDFRRKRGVMLNTDDDLLGSSQPIANRTPPVVLGEDQAAYGWDDMTPPHNDDPTELLNPAFMTDHELRARLMAPRGRLRVTAYSADGNEYVWVEAPRPYVGTSQKAGGDPVTDVTQAVAWGAVDADNGPKPLACDIVQPSGEGNTMGVHFVVEFALVPCAPESERLVLSHRWQTTMTHDDDYYLTRVTVGEIRFNGSILRAAKQQPDWFRGQFFHPIPLGFRRGGPVVRLSSDGLTMQYEIHDTDPTVTFDPGDSGATEMTIVETVNVLNRRLAILKAVETLKRIGAAASDWVGGMFRGRLAPSIWPFNAIPRLW